MNRVIKRHVIFVLMILTFNINAKEPFGYYCTKDSYGNPVYTDKRITGLSDEQSSSQPLTEIQTTKFKIANIKVQTTKTGKENLHSRRNKKERPSINSACDRIKKEIQKLETFLRRKSDATEFDKMKANLNQLRWQRVKHC